MTLGRIKVKQYPLMCVEIWLGTAWQFRGVHTTFGGVQICARLSNLVCSVEGWTFSLGLAFIDNLLFGPG